MLVSIITPTFNHSKYIAKCIESVIKQRYKEWEMIVIDDGSTDNTGEIVKNYAKDYPQIQYLYQPNKGLERLSETYNFALKHTKGDLLAILEGDDYWYEDKLEKQVDIFKSKKDIVLAWCRVDLVQENEAKFNSYPIHYKEARSIDYNNSTPAAILNIFLKDFPVPVGWVISKNSLVQIGGFLQSKGMPTVDMDTLYALSLQGKFHYSNEPLCAYRRSVNQATRKLTIEITKGSCDITKAFYLKLSDETRKNIHFSFKELERKCEVHMSIAYSKFGRSCLVRKEFKEARESYLKSLTIGGISAPVWKLRSIIGLFFSFLKSDFEIFAKKSYR